MRSTIDPARGGSRAQIFVGPIGIGFAKDRQEARSLWMHDPLRRRIGIRLVVASAQSAQAKTFHKDIGLCQQNRQREQELEQER
jgi:hypothetical protein